LFNPYDYYITPDEYEEALCNGISNDCLTSRIRKLALEKQRVINTPQQKRVNRSNLTAIAKANGISYSSLLARLGYGWDEHRASTKPIRDEKGLKDNAIRMSQMNHKYPR
jgi:hypothetical protein